MKTLSSIYIQSVLIKDRRTDFKRKSTSSLQLENKAELRTKWKFDDRQQKSHSTLHVNE